MIIDPELREVGEPIVNVAMSLSQAETVRDGIADVLCWLRGWRAGARKRALASSPIGADVIQELNIALKRAIEKVETK